MNDLIQAVGDFLGKEVDPRNYLLVGAAFGKHSVFIYEKNARRPFAVVKIPGNEEGEEHCANEFKCVTYLNETRPPGIRAPEALGAFDHEGGDVYVYKTLFSKPLYCMIPLLTRRHKKRYFHLVTEHLIKMYDHSRRAVNVEGKSYALCFKHGDLWAGNLGVKGGDLVLYDLEFGRLSGKPLADFLHFGLYYQVVVNNIGAVGGEIVKGSYERGKEKRIFKPTAETIRSAFMAKNRLSGIMRGCIRRYTRACRINARDARDLIFDYFYLDRGVNTLEKTFAEKIVPRS